MSEPFSGVKNRREAGLKVDDPVAAEVFGLFVGHAFERFLGLQDGYGVGKSEQIFSQAALVGTLMKPERQFFRVVGGQCGIA